ncbi:MAG: IPT/TIG domain-containing protein, partial [Chryseolinea sp.]
MNSNASYSASRFFFWMIFVGVGLLWISCADVFDLPGPSKAPRIISISPDSGGAAMRVLISGRNFSKTLGENGVKFNEIDAVVVAALDTQLVALVPAHAGTGIIRVTVNKLAVEGPVFTFFETPIVDRISPMEGKPGTVVTIYGKYFDTNATNNIVRFGGKIGTVIPPAKDSVLTVTVPADAVTGLLTVTISGIVGVGPQFVVLPSNTPVHSITGITPNNGQAGTVVTITGVNFDPTPTNNIVQFNGLAAEVISASATTLTVVAPIQGTTGLVSVTINNLTANGSIFTYVDNALTPTIANYDPNLGYVGDIVAIVGTNFSAVPASNTVKFNGVTAVVSQASTTLLQVTVPIGATTGTVSVTVGTKTGTGPIFNVLDNSPTITSFTPTSGPVGTAVTITGTNFGTDPAAAVIMFNGVLASTQQITPTSLITVVPNGATTGKITVTVYGKTGTSPLVFTVTSGQSGLAMTGGLSYPRSGHTATLLPNGKVLIAGGSGPNATFMPCEIYDPATGVFSVTGTLNTTRGEHNAFLLSNGKVLVIGGHQGTTTANICEVYDPATEQWTEAGSMANLGLPANPTYRFGSGRAVMLADGRVLATGGGNAFLANGFKAEIYDPTTAVSTLTDVMPDGDRVFHTNTLLNNGKVLLAGEDHGNDANNTLLFDPATNAWTTTGKLALNRTYATATLLADGKVLLAGGYEYINSATTAICTLYDPASGTWTNTGTMVRARLNFASVRLPDGKVLVVGGSKSDIDY